MQVILFHTITIILTILFTKYNKQLLRCLSISKEETMKTFCCRWISNRWRPILKHEMGVSSPDNSSERSLQICVIHFQHRFPAKCFRLEPCVNKTLYIWTRGIKWKTTGKHFQINNPLVYKQTLTTTERFNKHYSQLKKLFS